MKSELAPRGHLQLRPLRSRPHAARGLRIPGLGRVMLTRDRGDAGIFASEVFASHLAARVFGPDGRLRLQRALGSGLVTNVGANLLAADFTLASAPVLKAMNQHQLGTGTAAAAVSDIALQTPIGAGSLTGSTNGYMAGTQSWVAPNQYRTVATFSLTGSAAVTEWGLMAANAAAITGTATSVGNNSLTNTGASFPTAGSGLAGYTVEASASAVNTPTTTAMAQIASNTGTVLTLLGGSGSGQWLTLADAAASNPTGTTPYVIVPSMWDRKVFSPINLNNGDSIQIIYTLTCASGG